MNKNSRRSGLLSALGVGLPVVAAPMAGGASTPELVIAAGHAEALGFLAGGYKSVDVLADQIRTVRDDVAGFGVNLFVPNPVPVDPAEFRAYAARIAPVADRYDLDTRNAEVVEDDDHYDAKVGLLLEHPVPVVSFTFGMPTREVVAAFTQVGTRTVQTVVNLLEAQQAAALGMDGLVVQGHLAGGHSATTTPSSPIPEIDLPQLVADIAAGTSMPVWAAGGIATPADVSAVRGAGAEAAVVGTVLLRTPESGASPAHRRALTDEEGRETMLTRAFSGRPARALRNGFVDEYDAAAPPGYPAIHHLTAPIRRAATAAGDIDNINAWAGAGYRHATEEPVGAILSRLAQL